MAAVPPLPPLQLANSSSASARGVNGNIYFAPYETDSITESFEALPKKAGGLVLPSLLLLAGYFIAKRLK